MSETSEELKTYSLKEVGTHTSRDDLWMIVNGKVLDVSKFVDEHPGGEEVLLDCGGQEATNAFEDVGHSEDAVDILNGLVVGNADPNEVTIKVKKETASRIPVEESSSSSLIFLIIAALVAAGAFFYLQTTK